jgi:hypothetical protein
MNQQSQPTSLYPVERGDELDLIGLWKVLVEYKFLIIVFTTLTTLGATYYASILPTVYKAEVLMFSASDSTPQSHIGKLAGMAGVSLGRSNIGTKGEKELARLKTRSFLINHIKEQDLKPILFADQWSESTNIWINKEPSDRKAAELLLSMITIIINPKDPAGLVVFSLEWENPSNPIKIADIVNNLVDSMNFHAKQRAIVEAKKSISFLEKELEQTSVLNSQTMLYSMIEQQMQKIMLANVVNEFIFKIIDPAVIPEKAEDKPILLVIFIGMFLGVFFGSITAVGVNWRITH